MLFKRLFFICFIGVTLCNETLLRSKQLKTITENVTGDYISRNKIIWTPTFKNNTASGTNITTINKVNIKLYYETLCPASVRFFTRQLKPVMEKLSSYVIVELVPYGHARTSKFENEYTFRCQHGPAECYGNMLQACVIDAIQNRTQAVLFNACLIQYPPYRSDSGFDYITVLNWCGYKLNILINGVWECMNSSRGQILLKNYGEQTHAVRPQYVPYLLIDGSRRYENEALNNLMSTICRMLHPSPPPCYTS